MSSISFSLLSSVGGYHNGEWPLTSAAMIVFGRFIMVVNELDIIESFFVFLLLAPTQNSQDLEKSTCSRDPIVDETRGDSKSYQPISMFCVAYKIFGRLIYARVKPIINPLLPREQAKFRCQKSTVDYVILKKILTDRQAF